jgi:hypothetical protein
MRPQRFVAAAAALTLLLPLTLGAQRRGRVDDDFRRYPRGEFGISGVYGLPSGEFRDYVRQGWGVDGYFRWNVDRAGILSFRLDGGFLGYGREHKRVPLSSTIGGRILVDLTTSNNIVDVGIGPQLTTPDGPIRPYVNAAGTFSYFFTESSVEGSNNNDSFAETTNYDDYTFGWAAGGGLLIPLGVRQDVMLDLGVRYRANGNVTYLTKGGIEDLPDGGIRLNPIASDANLVAFRIGISVPIR